MSNQESNQESNQDIWKGGILFLKNVMLQQGVKEFHLAKQINVSPSTIKRIFDLEFCPKLDIFIAMAKALNCKIFLEHEHDLNPEKSTIDLSQIIVKLDIN